ncbi:hypothetical protein RY831_00005, partial [Noviherbaspirillum sp. CPCC 100848]
MIERIVVPPRRRNEVEQLDDLRIVKALHNIITAPHTWTVTLQSGAQGGRVLTYTRNDVGTNNKSPVVTLTTNRAGVLESFAMHSAQSIHDNDTYIAHFANPLAPPQAVRLQQMPRWLADTAFNEASSSNTRRITPPTPPYAKRTRVTTPPISPRTYAGLQQAARDSLVASDPGVLPALLQAETLSLMRPNGLLVDHQGHTLEHYFHQGITIGNACGSHATNQAFQGNVVGLSLQGASINQILGVLAQQRQIKMDDVGIIVDPVQGIHSEAELEALAARLEYSGTAIVEVGGQEWRAAEAGGQRSQEMDLQVTQHFVTLVRHAIDGRVYLLDSMHPEQDVSYDTARQALEAQFNIIDENDENSPRYLSVLVPRQGQVLEPAPLNPQGAYLPNQGFMPLDELREEHLNVVEELHGENARGRLERAIEGQSQARLVAGERHWEDSLQNEPQYNIEPSDYRQTQDASRSTAIWPQQHLDMPASATGRTADQGLATGSNNVMSEAQIGDAPGMSRSRQAAAGASAPAGWQHARDALMAHLAHEYHYSYGA